MRLVAGTQMTVLAGHIRWWPLPGATRRTLVAACTRVWPWTEPMAVFAWRHTSRAGGGPVHTASAKTHRWRGLCQAPRVTHSWRLWRPRGGGGLCRPSRHTSRVTRVGAPAGTHVSAFDRRHTACATRGGCGLFYMPSVTRSHDLRVFHISKK